MLPSNDRLMRRQASAVSAERWRCEPTSPDEMGHFNRNNRVNLTTCNPFGKYRGSEAGRSPCVHRPKGGTRSAVGRRGRCRFDPIQQEEARDLFVEDLRLAGISNEGRLRVQAV